MVADEVATADERLPKSILRCAFSAVRRPLLHWEVSEEEGARRRSEYEAMRASAVKAELVRLSGEGPEPAWPDFETEGTRKNAKRRRRTRIGDPAHFPDEMESPKTPAVPVALVDEQAAAIWLSAVRPILDVVARPWLRELARHYADFTANLNGAGLGQDEELSHTPHEWNGSYYQLLARSLVGLSANEIESLALSRIVALPDEPFLDVAPDFVRAVDAMYFNDHLLEQEAASIRERCIDRLVQSWGWRSIIGRRSGSIRDSPRPLRRGDDVQRLHVRRPIEVLPLSESHRSDRRVSPASNRIGAHRTELFHRPGHDGPLGGLTRSETAAVDLDRGNSLGRDLWRRHRILD